MKNKEALLLCLALMALVRLTEYTKLLLIAVEAWVLDDSDQKIPLFIEDGNHILIEGAMDGKDSPICDLQHDFLC